MADGMKNETVDTNVQNAAEESSSAGDDIDCETLRGFRDDAVESASDEDVVTGGSIARLDPFHSDKQKRAMLVSHVKRMSPHERKAFMMSPIAPGLWLECYILRTRTGFTKFSRKFSLHLEDGTLLAVCVKRAHNKTANYLVSTSPEDMSRDSKFFVGKIRSNFMGSEFTAYDTGVNPKDLAKIKGTTGGSALTDAVRQEMCSIAYDTFMFGKKKPGPRKMRVVLPHVEEHKDGTLVRTECKALAQDVDGLQALTEHFSQSTVTSGKKPLVRTYVNKHAVWNERMKSYVLNFNNRVSKASVKNFQLVQSDDANDVYLQFGRYENEKFNLDFRYPVAPFQALAIALSSLDYKLCSE
eukprot:GEMP01012736.1.p1 GENE.GEMP01012736.1~~GEMP01012736.1.p1  ORF type:complete len:355 (+),score=71.26 GEMP01012736.1:115-1179(+)